MQQQILIQKTYQTQINSQQSTLQKYLKSLQTDIQKYKRNIQQQTNHLKQLSKKLQSFVDQILANKLKINPTPKFIHQKIKFKQKTQQIQTVHQSIYKLKQQLLMVKSYKQSQIYIEQTKRRNELKSKMNRIQQLKRQIEVNRSEVNRKQIGLQRLQKSSRMSEVKYLEQNKDKVKRQIRMMQKQGRNYEGQQILMNQYIYEINKKMYQQRQQIIIKQKDQKLVEDYKVFINQIDSLTKQKNTLQQKLILASKQLNLQIQIQQKHKTKLQHQIKSITSITIQIQISQKQLPTIQQHKPIPNNIQIQIPTKTIIEVGNISYTSSAIFYSDQNLFQANNIFPYSIHFYQTIQSKILLGLSVNYKDNHQNLLSGKKMLLNNNNNQYTQIQIQLKNVNSIVVKYDKSTIHTIKIIKHNDQNIIIGLQNAEMVGINRIIKLNIYKILKIQIKLDIQNQNSSQMTLKGIKMEVQKLKQQKYKQKEQQGIKLRSFSHRIIPNRISFPKLNKIDNTQQKLLTSLKKK